MIRVVLDTNIFVSYLLSNKNSSIHKVWKLWQDGEIVVFLCRESLEELARVLLSDKIKKLTKLNKKQIKEFLKLINERSLLLRLEKIPQIIQRDPTDNKFLALAIKSQADYIVTGDKDLLQLEEYKGIKILKPNKFTKKIK